MKKLNPKELKADWSRYERRTPWHVISSRELSEVLGVHLQTINNWSIRGILPAPEKHPRLIQNKNYYRIASVRAWLNGTDEETESWLWIKQHLPKGIDSIEQAQYVCKHGWRALEIEMPDH